MSDARTTRMPYPSDVRDEEWAFVAPYLTLMRQDAPQRPHDLPGPPIRPRLEPDPTRASAVPGR